jgi:hypothetical protein
MGTLPYVPRKSTLLLLFEKAAWRLVDSSEGLSQLSEVRLAALTEELNRVADEIREASTRVSIRDDAALRPSSWDQQSSVPIATDLAGAQGLIRAP